MLGEIEEEIGGRRRRFRLTLDALERICKVQPQPAVLVGMLEARHYELAELRVILDATLEAAGEDIRSGHVIEALKIEPAAALALRIMKAGFEADPGNGSAAANDPTTDAGASDRS